MLLVRALFLTLLAVVTSYNTAFAEKLNQRPEFNYLGTAIVDVLTTLQGLYVSNSSDSFTNFL